MIFDNACNNRSNSVSVYISLDIIRYGLGQTYVMTCVPAKNIFTISNYSDVLLFVSY